MLSRRTFVSWLSGFGAALGIGVRPRASEAKAKDTSNVSPQAPQLDQATVTPLAEAVLPSELGTGFARVSRGFTQWINDYRAGAELVHPYGSTNIRRTGESPVGRWRTQLAQLDRDARAKHQKAFAALTRDQRREVVVSALGTAERTNRMPDPLDAGHVALALVAWYFAQPEAANLCYQARIDRNQCRPLVNAPRQPLPLAGGRGV